ncbi:hypothetical protein DPMN_010726 [Dreissena polymorpha]|uniref:Uncharacterized protein n=1 Tax=Dreissena polymorpha TaxID=45954 RepID=A0A9D4MZ89_DREPO|nr:hypothetical protein DPMN_010726 [Dreissena polymorpha]
MQEANDEWIEEEFIKINKDVTAGNSKNAYSNSKTLIPDRGWRWKFVHTKGRGGVGSAQSEGMKISRSGNFPFELIKP